MSEGLNPLLEIGDEVICYHMEGEMNVPPGTKGTVVKIQNDPIVPNSLMYQIKWENGQSLPLLSDVDTWKKSRKKIEEQSGDPIYDIYRRNPELFKHFDYRFFRDFFIKLRDSGIVNMFASYPLLYAGREHIERYYGEGRDDEKFQDLLNVADESKNKLIQGVLDYVESKNLEIEFDEEGMRKINSLAKTFAKELFQVYANSL
jgi:hypothetical protein